MVQYMCWRKEEEDVKAMKDKPLSRAIRLCRTSCILGMMLVRLSLKKVSLFNQEPSAA